jgi:glycine betaine/choline ABC-type transport system substrate-binding protein
LCKDALVSYGITYPPKQRESLAACDAPIAQALQSKGIDFAWLCSTQPAIAQFGFVLLADDKQTQPAENMTALVRDDLLAQVGDKAAFQKLLDDVLAKLTTEQLTKMGVEVAVDQKDVADVAKAFLQANGLLK